MAQYDQYGNVKNEEFGTQATHAHGESMVTQGVRTGATSSHGLSGGKDAQQLHKQHGQQEKPHRTGSSNSSSSEDDGEGGRSKKKEFTQKIKEKISGVGKKEQQSHNTSHNTTTTNLTGDEVNSHEDKYFNVLRR